MSTITDFRRWQPWLILAFSILTGLVVFTGLLPGLRPLVVLVFYITCPGLALVRLFQVRNVWAEAVLMIALSLVIDSIVAMLLLYAGLWSYITGLLIIIGISLLGAGLSIGQSSRSDRISHTPGRPARSPQRFDPLDSPDPSANRPEAATRNRSETRSRMEGPLERPIGLPVRGIFAGNAPGNALASPLTTPDEPLKGESRMRRTKKSGSEEQQP